MAVYTPETITDNQYSSEGIAPTSVSSSNTPVSTTTPETQTNPYTVKPNTEKIVAFDVIGLSIDTHKQVILGNYSFGQVGALAIGEYVPGESGDIRISPNGIIARNVNGDITILIDGTTGDVTVKGTITAGSLVTGNVVVQGAGAFIVNDGSYDVILLGYQSGGF